ncbi:MAG: tyrosine-type recombinase/integrase [Proteobacteria bacterium]|nr:tyrosine-type recombinase/integrase [Pseudomonadota bacterium]MBU1570203.1 tyrosine-type recombinase/integrase [Pseudomonadota bacterium]
MDITDAIIRYRRFLKRRNVSPNTVKSYLNGLKHFVLWLDVRIEEVTHRKMTEYIDCLLSQRLRPKTINCYLNTVCQFYHYLNEEEGVQIVNPVKKPNIMKLPRGLPRHLKDEHIEILFKNLKGRRDQAMFALMLRCGLRVEEVAHLSLGNIDLKRRTLLIQDGKDAKDRIVYISNDALHAFMEYLRVRPVNKVKKVFLVEKGPLIGQSISIRGIQKRMEYYARRTNLRISCHHLRHTMATQMLNADADLSTIQDLLGHNSIRTTQRYCRVSNLKVQRDYFKAMEVIMQRTADNPNNS